MVALGDEPAQPASVRFLAQGKERPLSAETAAGITVDLLELFKFATNVHNETDHRPGDDEIQLLYSSPVTVERATEGKTEIIELSLSLSGDLSLCSRESSTAVFRIFNKLESDKLARVVCRSELALEGFAKFCLMIRAQSDLMSEDVVQQEINSRCGVGLANESYIRCVESTLHDLWEQRRILYTVYDHILKTAWSKAEANAPEAIADRKLHQLFDRYLEQEKLEREIQRLYASSVRDRFQYISDAISEKGAQQQMVPPRSGSPLRKVQTLLADLLKSNPDLPPSPYLEPPFTEELQSIPAATAGFKSVGPSIEDAPTLNTTEIAAPPGVRMGPYGKCPSSPVDEGGISGFFKHQVSRRLAAISFQREVSKRAKRILEIVTTRTHSGSEQSLDLNERDRLQNEINEATQKFVCEYGAEQ